MLLRLAAAFALVFLGLAAPAMADEPIKLILKNHKFTPSTVRVKANQPSQILFINQDDTAEEFDSASLKVEKVVAGHSQGKIRLRALAKGKYTFMGEFHAATAQGVVIAE